MNWKSKTLLPPGRGNNLSRCVLLTALLLAVLWPLTTPAASARIKITTTTSMVSDLVQSIGGDRVEVSGLMGAGVDPHLYKASASDLTKLQRADIIFYSGLLVPFAILFAGLAAFGAYHNPEGTFNPRRPLFAAFVIGSFL